MNIMACSPCRFIKIVSLYVSKVFVHNPCPFSNQVLSNYFETVRYILKLKYNKCLFWRPLIVWLAWQTFVFKAINVLIRFKKLF